MPDNFISEEEFLALSSASIDGVEKQEDDFISEEEFLALGKSTDPASDTDSGSGDGSLESPSWGDKISNTFNAYINPFTPMAERPMYAAGVDIGEVKEKQRKTSEKYVSDKSKLEKELDKAFKDNKLFTSIIENPSELTLQERDVNAGDFGTPEEYLLDVVKKELGGFGLFSGGRTTPEGYRNKEGEIIGTKGDVYYPNLTNSDIESIIADKFQSKLALEKENKANNLALNTKENIEKQGINIREWQNDNRKTLINGYSGVKKEIANLVESINNGGLGEVERTAAYKKLLAKKDENKTSMLFNSVTGELVIARDKEDADARKGNDENLVDLGVEGKQAEWNDILGRMKPENQLDYLKNEFERSALTLSGHNQELNEVRSWSILRSGFEIAGDDGQGGNRRIVESSLRDLMVDTEFANFAPVPAEDLRRKKGETDSEYNQRKEELKSTWETNVKESKQDELEYTREFEALKGMYLLNEGLVDIEKPEYIPTTIIPKNMAALKQSTGALLKPWTSEFYVGGLLGATNRDVLTSTGEVYDNLGIEKTAAEEKQLKKSINENVNDGVLGMNKMLIEFYGLNKVLGVVGAEAAFGRLTQALGTGRYVKNGKVITEAAIKARADKAGLSIESYLSGQSGAGVGGRIAVTTGKDGKKVYNGMRYIKASAKDKAMNVVASGLMEGVKFELFTQVDLTTGKLRPDAFTHSGFADGFGFGAMGRIIAPLSPLLQQKGYLKDIDKSIKIGSREARIGLNSRKLFDTFVTAPASFVTGTKAAGYLNALKNDAMGTETISNYIDKEYGGTYGEIGSGLIVDYFIGLGLGVGHFKGFSDFKSKAGLRRVRTQALDKMRESGRLAELTESEQNNILSERSQDKIHENLSSENLQEFYKHYEIFDGMSGRLHDLYRAEGYMDPARADELVKDDHKQFLAEEKAAGRKVKLEVVNNNKLKFGQKAIDPNRNAEIYKDPTSKITTIRYNAEKYSPDVMPHEVHHYYTEELFGQDAVFKGEFMSTLNDIGGKIKLKRLVTEKEAKELGNEGLKGQKMTLSQSIKLEKFDLTSASNQQRISQWELFAHISEQIGNKNNYFDIKNSGESNGFESLRGLLSTLGKTTGKKLNLSKEKDVVEWFTRYAENVKKGKSVVKMFSELENVIDFEGTAIREAERLAEGRTGTDTYSSKTLDLGDGRKVNDPKEMAAERQKDYEKAISDGKSKLDLYREMVDSNPTRINKEGKREPNPNYDANYPVLGKKLGPMLDIALSSWNRAVGDNFRIKLDPSWDSKRSGIAMDYMASKSRGFENIFEKYEPINKETGSPQKLMTWVVGRLRQRMQETIEAGVGKITDIRESKVGDWNDFERIFEDVDGAGGKVDKSFDEVNPNVKKKGIYLPEFEFNFEGDAKRKMNPTSVENIKVEAKKVFLESKLEENTGLEIGKRLESIGEAAMNELIGIKEGMKPKDIDPIQSAWFNKNKAISYDAGLELTSNPNFYENTNAAKSIFNFAHKKTGIKYSAAELSVEEARRTNARAYKYEKRKATEQLVDKVQEVINTGRDAGVRVAKQNFLKKGLAKHFSNQIYRESLIELKQEIDSNLKDPASDVKYWLEQKAKLEGVNAELAMRKLRGAVPEKLASKDLDVMDNFIKDVKGIDYAKELFPGFYVRNLIENTKEYKQLLEKTGGVDSFLKDMGYELKGIDLKTFQKYAEAQRILGTLNTKVVEPKIYKNWSDKDFAKEIKSVFQNEGLQSQLKVGEQGWYKNWDNVKEFDGLVDWMKDNMLGEVFNSQMMKKSVGMGLGKVKFATEQEGVFKTRNNPYWNNLIKNIKTSKGKTPKWVNEYKTTDNGNFKEALNKELATADLSTPQKIKQFGNYITKKYLTKKGVSYEDTIKANEKAQEYVYGKLFDYYNSAPNKAVALNNIFRLLQLQTSIGNGFTRSLATHNAITLRHVKNWGKGEGLEKTHSEHEFQTFGFNANFMLNMIKNSGNKATFLNNFKPLSKIFKQSIIDRGIQKKYDGIPYGGTTGFDFKFTTESGKYPWLRERVIAETTLDLKTGKTYDQLLTDVIGGAKAVKILEARKNKMLKQVGVDAKKMSPTEKILAMKTVDTALELGRKKNKKARGMSTWDFDDTLATTKSGVRARIPNTDGKPKPNRKVVFLAGGAGSGKGNVIKKLNLEGQGFKIVNSDISLEWLKKNNGLPENMNDFTKEQRSTLGSLQHQSRGIAKRKMMKYQGEADGVVVDGTGGSIKSMEKLVNEFKEKGYDVSMLFVETSLPTALARNKARAERSLLDKIVEKNHEAVQGNKAGFAEMFGERFMEVKTDNLKQADAMPKDLIDKMNDFVSGYEKIRLDAEQFATEGKSILDRGGEFDFGEFNVVTKGEKGPFFQKALDRAKKFGTKDQFILTARPPEAAIPIHEFLKSQGLDIPLENITGLGNSTGEAKAMWMLKKFAEGYNDMYFADDAMQNVKAVKDALGRVDARSKVVQAKAINEVKDVNKLDSPDTYDNILASKDLRLEFEKTIAKNRPDLVKAGLVSKTVDEMFAFVDGLDVPVNKKKKYKRITTKWLATSNIKLKEDGYKIKQAVEIAEKHKEDIFSYRNPNELIEKYAGKTKAKPTNPKKVKEFRFSGSHKEKGITTYEVENTKEGQEAVRKVIDTHWGKDSNPWCITQVKEGKLTDDAWQNWTVYNKSPKRIIFHKGKLSSFFADHQYWDRMDSPTDAPVVQIKEGRVTRKVELVPYTKDGVTKIEEFVRETRTVSKDKKTVTTEIIAETQDGYAEGTKIVENRVNGITVKSTRSHPGFISGKMRVQEIINFDKKGKATNNITFQGKPTAINRYGTPFGDMSRRDIVMKKGDLLSHEMSKDGFSYFHGEVKMNNQVTEIGFKTPEKMGDLRDFVTTSPSGEIRADFKKILEVDPGAHGLPKEVVKPQAKEGIQALEPVRQVLDQLDIKSDVQQALASKNLDININNIMEHSLDIESKKVFSKAEAKVRGKDIRRRRVFMTDSAADLELLIEPLYGKGKEGIKNKKWLKESFVMPFERGIRDYNTARQNAKNDYMNLRKQNKDVVKEISKAVEGTTFTNDMAMRVYLWNKAGYKIPDLAKTTEAKLVQHIINNPKLQAYAENFAIITKQEKGLKEPGQDWWAETMAGEVTNINRGVSRKQYLQEWIDVKNEIFTEENLNKMESKLGTRWRENVEDMFDRMETGRTRSLKMDRGSAMMMNYLNGGIGTIMNFNTRSAVLQTISTTNFLNMRENNPIAAARAMGNVKQFAKDFKFIMNSDMLKQRRDGLAINVTEAEIASAAASSENPIQSIISKVLKAGYLPTKMADSFAISLGGATFYRNRIKMYEKQGMKTKEAEKQAFLDFQWIAERTQQSSRADLLSRQQTSLIGRFILPFANTPMQMNRAGMKDILDISKGRFEGGVELTEKVGRISYYMGVQVAIFAGLQTALFAMLLNDDDVSDEKIANTKAYALQTTADSMLRGFGIQGAVLSSFKNAMLEYLKQSDKGYNADYGEVAEDLLNISPPIGSKFGMLDAAGDKKKWAKIKKNDEFKFELGNPSLEASLMTIQATTNAPVYSPYQNIVNLQHAMNDQYETWQRILMGAGWTPYNVGIEREDKKKKKKKRGRGKVRTGITR